MEHSLLSVAVVSLHQHDLLANMLALLDGTEAKDISKARVSLLVAMSNTHAPSSSYIEPFEIAVLVNDGNESDIVGKEINVISWGHRNCDLELQAVLFQYPRLYTCENYVPFAEGKIHRTTVLRPSRLRLQ